MAVIAGFGLGVTGVPAGYVLVTVAWMLFTVGYLGVARHVPHAGPFFAQIARGLGAAPGVAGAAVGLLAYNAIICCLYGLLGATMAGYFGGPWWVWALAAWLVVAVLGLRHVRLSAAVLMMFLATEIVVVVVFDIAALTHPAGGHSDLSALAPWRLSGPGVGGVIALTVACFLGCETTPAFAEEARSHRHLRAASFAAVLVLGGLFTVSAWAVGVVAGPDELARVSGDLFFTTLADHAGLLVLILAQLLLVTSILAAMISVHQTVARYVFVLAREALLPSMLGEVRVGHAAPVGGSVMQSMIGLAVLGVWAVLGGNPIVLFAWLAALAAVALMTLMIVACVPTSTARCSRRRGEVQRGLEVVEFACGISSLLKGEFSDQVSSRRRPFSFRQPLGVCAGITPFNFPAMVPMWMYPIAIATGNTFVLKPSRARPLRLDLAEL